MLRGVAGDALLERITTAPGEAGIFLDFDGVLAPIVARPEDAYPPDETRAELERLVERYALVGVISGRAGEDVHARVGVDGIVYVGSHGLELNPDAERWRGRIRDFTSTVPWAEHHTELKGLTVAFHFRDASDERAAVVELEEVAARATDEGLVARFGRAASSTRCGRRHDGHRRVPRGGRHGSRGAHCGDVRRIARVAA
jgi:trehalose-phosphatase